VARKKAVTDLATCDAYQLYEHANAGDPEALELLRKQYHDKPELARIQGNMVRAVRESRLKQMMGDNAPGMDSLQRAAMHAADEIFVPAELKQFSMNGIRDMDSVIRHRYPDAARITRIIPLFYRDTKAQNAHWEKLREEFPDKVVQTPIPYDTVFDELISEGRNLFLHRLSSRGAAYYLKLMHELFGLQEESTWQMVMDKRKRRRSDDARHRVSRRPAVTGGAGQSAPVPEVADAAGEPAQSPAAAEPQQDPATSAGSIPVPGSAL